MPQGKIQNAEALSGSGLREVAVRIIEAGLAAIDTGTVVRNSIARTEDGVSISGTHYSARRIFFCGIGKCAVDAGTAVEALLGERLAGGAVLDIKKGSFRRIRSFEGDHPMPSERNVAAAKEIIAFLKELTEGDLLIAVISGGGSTLLSQPEGGTAKDEAEILAELFRAGAAIQDINLLRKHISSARGGFLAQYAYPAQVVSLVFSDVPGNDLAVIASGPTVRDTTTAADARGILEKFRLADSASARRIALLETPKEEKYFERVTHVLLVSNRIALEAMAREAEGAGYAAQIRDTALTGEARDAAQRVLRDLRAAPPKSALFYGGETTVTIRGKGQGGRNQEFSLAALGEIREGELLCSLASDGRDNSDAAGALCDTIVKENASRLGVDAAEYLERNDSYSFFKQAGGWVITGQTGSNVSDLMIGIRQ